MSGWKRDKLRLRCPSARSIEETGLDSCRVRSDDIPIQRRYGGGAAAALGTGTASSRMDNAGQGTNSADQHHHHRRKKLGSKPSFRSPSFRARPDAEEHQLLQDTSTSKQQQQQQQQQQQHFRRRFRRGHTKSLTDVCVPQPAAAEDTQDGTFHGMSLGGTGDDAQRDAEFSSSNANNPFSILRVKSVALEDSPLDELLPNNMVLTPRKSSSSSSSSRFENLTQADDFSVVNVSPLPQDNQTKLADGITQEKEEEEVVAADTLQPPSSAAAAAAVGAHLGGARNRWRRLRHTVVFANHLAHIKNTPTDLLEEKRMEEMNEGAGGVGAAAFEGSKTGSQPRLKGRKGMEGLIVRQDKSFISFMQDFYVACLKIPFGYFLAGVFLAPVALGLIFTPLYLINTEGLTFDESMGEQGFIGSLASVKEKCFAMLSVFLYSLSLSTTFGGSPVNAVSPYCLLLANVNTLMAQFLFVFLSGAVFARMSQPNHPVRCSKKAIIRTEDCLPTSLDGSGEKLKYGFKILNSLYVA